MRVGGIENVKRWSANQLAAVMVRDIERLRSRGPRRPAKCVFSINGEAVARASVDASFAALMSRADIVHADGRSAVWASRWAYRSGARERVATTDFVWTAAKAGAAVGARFYLLGARQAVVEEAAAALQAAAPGIEIVGARHGYFDASEEPAVVDAIRQSGADVVWVGLGRPRQESFCVRNRDALASVAWLKTCGGTFDFCAGRHARAPLWMQRSGLEWLYRAAREPVRLGPRYLWTNAVALYRFLTASGPRRRGHG